MSLFTIFGGNGFIGRHLAAALDNAGQPVHVPERGSAPEELGELGHAVYCIGLTADFRERPYDTMDAHVGYLSQVLRTGRFQSFLYLSSTRIYDGASHGSEEMMLSVDPWSPNDLYNLSKLSGEALCLNHPNPKVRVARLSNVYGSAMFAAPAENQNFLGSIIRSALSDRHVVLQTSASSSKDYIHIQDVVRALAMISIDGEERLYNVASGRAVSHEHLLDRISEITGCSWSVSGDAPFVSFPAISTSRITGAFRAAGIDWAPMALSDKLPDLIHAARGVSNPTRGAVA